MTAGSPTGASGNRFPCYGCNRSTCAKKVTGKPTASKSIDIVHEDFRVLLRSLKPLDEGVGRLYKQVVLRAWNDSFAKTTESKRSVRFNIEKAEELKVSIITKFVQDKLTEAEKNLQMQSVDKDLFELNRELETLSDYKDKNEVLVDTAMEFMTDPEKFWNKSATPVKKLIQQFLFPHGIFYDFETGYGTHENLDSHLLIHKIAGKSGDKINLVAGARIELATSGL